ncbi:hypothetical protein Q0590_34420 [Rhodocytophaga aerolata]|uniref:Uncharacterized protein n=1 Tax=Rhodocytophaga aerolata TaxID=455078 RepID=A0ABT8RI69_9BACT|nr:hypothetical protein [Rhodocytophaga aerolata]MDO1451421.1 hypothetical protein [Rhodocytophaga aerolata]
MIKDRQKIGDLFSMFHDFEIVEIEFNKPYLLLTVRIPWGQLWQDMDYQIKVSISGCEFLLCKYWKSNSSETHNTDNPKEIEFLELDVQRHRYTAPNTYEFVCNGNNCAGAELTFTADKVELWDKSGESLKLDKMKGWATDWWNNIQQMWDEQKDDKKNNY